MPSIDFSMPWWTRASIWHRQHLRRGLSQSPMAKKNSRKHCKQRSLYSVIVDRDSISLADILIEINRIKTENFYCGRRTKRSGKSGRGSGTGQAQGVFHWVHPSGNAQSHRQFSATAGLVSFHDHHTSDHYGVPRIPRRITIG